MNADQIISIKLKKKTYSTTERQTTLSIPALAREKLFGVLDDIVLQLWVHHNSVKRSTIARTKKPLVLRSGNQISAMIQVFFYLLGLDLVLRHAPY